MSNSIKYTETDNEKLTATPYKIIIIGDTSTGKSTLLHKITNNQFTESHGSTIGVDFKTKLVRASNGTLIKLRMWDTAGQERFRSIIKVYYSGTHGVILMFDLTNKTTFQNVVQWLNDIENENLSNCPIMLVGSKSDLVDKIQVDDLTIHNFIDDCVESGFNIKYIKCSSKTGYNVELLFSELANKLVNTNFEITDSEKIEIDNGDIYNLNNKTEQNESVHYSGNCCVIS